MWSPRMKKACYKVAMIICMLAAIPIVMVVRILRPIVLIRFRQHYTSSIGRLAPYPEIFMCERDSKLHGKRVIDLFYHSRNVSNYQLKKMIDRRLFAHPLIKPLDQANQLLPGGGAHIVPWRVDGDRDIHGLLSTLPTHLYFTGEEQRRGWDGLLDIGVPKEAPFACVLARDPAYQISSGRDLSAGKDRNSNIRNYLEAAETLADLGYYVLRMGAAVSEKFESDNRMIIDYASNNRSDFMDVFLAAHCNMFVSGCSGLDHVAMIFKRPVVRVNAAHLNHIHSYYKDGIFITKKHRVIGDDRYWTFHEIHDKVARSAAIAAARGSGKRWYQLENRELLENSPEEIRLAVLEMHGRLNGTWSETIEDQMLQEHFWKVARKLTNHPVVLAKIGSEFLRDNQDMLLDPNDQVAL